MPTASYERMKLRLESYFDRKALDDWARLTSDAPVSRIRATVRAGRDAMRATLVGWLSDDLSGRRVLDAGCGAGQLAVEAALRGAEVVGVDVAPQLVALAERRAASSAAEIARAGGALSFVAGDMLAHDLGRFDHVVAMDSLIHYGAKDMTAALGRLADRAERRILFTFAPRTPLLTAMHVVGRIKPGRDGAPFVAPVSRSALIGRIARAPELAGWRPGRSERVASGFYFSEALELEARS